MTTTDQIAVEMPAWVDRRHRDLNRAARECYTLRDATSSRDDVEFFHEVGDVYLCRAMALSAEWYVE